MYIKLIFKSTINNIEMYSPRLYKYQDSYIPEVFLYIPKVYAFGSVFPRRYLLEYSLHVHPHTHDVSAS